MAQRFEPLGVAFVFTYTREAHPGERYPHHTSMEQKLAHARDMAVRHGIRRPMLVDDLQGTVHRAYGKLPNMTYIVSTAGTVVYRADWTDPRTIRAALDQLVYERQTRRKVTRMTPYYVEWLPMRANEREPFMEGLAEIGPQAVEDFIAAVARTQGEAAAQQLRRWWEASPARPRRSRP